MKKLLFAAMCLSIAFTSCKQKENDPIPTPPPNPTLTKTQMLEKGKWKIAELKFKNTSGEQNLLDLMSECDKDNFYYFNADKTITSDEGATKCNTSDPQTTTDGKWALENTDSKLTFTESSIFGEKGNMALTVVSITEAQIEFTKDTTLVIPGLRSFDGKFNGKFANVK